MLICPTCNEHFEGEEHFCPKDGSPLSASPRADDPFIGRVLSGRYRLEERLGQGGMGTVYRAVHTLMDKPVAVKILRAEVALDNEAVARFHREARSASRLDHEHCIRVTDFGQTDDGLLYLVMELLDGVSLGSVCRRGPVPPERAAAIGVAIAEALEHAHELGIVHRDLKPDNVFLARRSRGRELVKVLDFGLAKLMHDAALGPSITRDGTVFGTPEYMAPEQAEGEKLDGRTDLYALGIILYHLVTGDVPFRAGNFVALLTKQVSEKPRPPRERRPDLDIPAGLEEIILKCLAKDREDRFAMAQELAEALAPLAATDSSRLMLLPSSDTSGARRLPTVETPTVDGDRPSQRLYRADSIENALGPASEGGDSVMRGELSEGLPRPPRRKLAVAVGGLALMAGVAGVAGVVWMAGRPKAVAPQPVVAAPPPKPPLELAAERLLAGDLDGAERLLKTERDRSDSVEVQEALASLAEAKSDRMWRAAALGHLEHAARLQPGNPEPRARLAALLFRLGHTADACKNARIALKLDPDGHRAPAAREVVQQARCPAQGGLP